MPDPIVLASLITTAGGVLVASIGAVVSLASKHRAAMGILDEINQAVNNVGVTATGEKAPPLWARIDVQTAAIGRVEGKLDVHIADRGAHRPLVAQR